MTEEQKDIAHHFDFALDILNTVLLSIRDYKENVNLTKIEEELRTAQTIFENLRRDCLKIRD